MVAKSDNKNVYKSKNRHEDRNEKKIEFPEFDVKIIKISTVLLLLKAREEEVVEKSLFHLDKYASLGNSQLQQLHENGLYEIISTLVINNSNNVIVKKFSFKLLAQLIHVIDECKKKLLNDASLIEETRNIFMTSSDDNFIEFSCLILHHICDDPRNVDAMGKDEKFMRSLFNNFHSHDPDILLQTFRLLNLIMRNSMLITFILNMSEFPFKSTKIELKNDCREIQFEALESILLISDIHHEHQFKSEFTSDRLIEVVYEICMQFDSKDTQQLALKIFKNILKDEKALAKLSKYLPNFLEIFKNSNSNREELLSVLTKFSTIVDNRKILIENGIVKNILEMLESGSKSACEAISVMSVDLKFSREILDNKVYEILTENFMNEQENWETRENILKSFQSLINIQGLSQLIEISPEISKNFSKILKLPPPFDTSMTLVSILEKLSLYSDVKEKISSNELASAIYMSLSLSNRFTKLIIRLLNLMANYIDQESFRRAFVQFSFCELLEHFMESKVYQLQSSACNLINMASTYPELCTQMINEGILRKLLTSFECSMCSDGFETMLNYDLSLKFAIRRRLEVSDKIKSGFYASKREIDFMTLKSIMEGSCTSPYYPVFSVNFGDEIKMATSLNCPPRSILSDKNLKTLHDSLTNDPTFNSTELHEKIKILAIKVSTFLQTSDDCTSHNFNMHLMELKFKFSSSVIPLGSLIYGNSFEAALLFKALADQFDIPSTFVADSFGCKAWNEICDGNNIVDLIFSIGEIYYANGIEARKYLQRIL